VRPGRPPLRAAAILGALFLALLAGLAYTPVIGAISRRLDTVPAPGRADAIVVLGAGVSRDGVLSNPSLRRLVGGLVLYRRGLAPRLILMGPAHQGSPIEAEVRAALARDVGIPPSAIVVEGGGLTTWHEAVLAARRVHEVGGRRVLLVTSAQHMHRARRFFERAGLEVVAAPVIEISPAVESPGGRLDLARAVLQEALARVYYRVSGRL
jgi:uncharacterized SAM-binding protein YcdF (DUF218 family)